MKSIKTRKRKRGLKRKELKTLSKMKENREIKKEKEAFLYAAQKNASQIFAKYLYV